VLPGFSDAGGVPGVLGAVLGVEGSASGVDGGVVGAAGSAFGVTVVSGVLGVTVVDGVEVVGFCPFIGCWSGFGIELGLFGTVLGVELGAVGLALGMDGLVLGIVELGVCVVGGGVEVEGVEVLCATAVSPKASTNRAAIAVKSEVLSFITFSLWIARGLYQPHKSMGCHRADGRCRPLSGRHRVAVQLKLPSSCEQGNTAQRA
jgi:hypothetical protein